jgi:hypothetical protein
MQCRGTWLWMAAGMNSLTWAVPDNYNKESRTLGVEVDNLNGNCEFDAHALALAARARVARGLAEGGRRHAVARTHQVEHVPHVLACTRACARTWVPVRVVHMHMSLPARAHVRAHGCIVMASPSMRTISCPAYCTHMSSPACARTCMPVMASPSMRSLCLGHYTQDLTTEETACFSMSLVSSIMAQDFLLAHAGWRMQEQHSSCSMACPLPGSRRVSKMGCWNEGCHGQSGDQLPPTFLRHQLGMALATPAVGAVDQPHGCRRFAAHNPIILSVPSASSAVHHAPAGSPCRPPQACTRAALWLFLECCRLLSTNISS